MAGADASPPRPLCYGYNPTIPSFAPMGTTEAQFEQVIASFSAPIQSLVREVRKLIHRILPEVVEVAWMQQKNIGFGTGAKKNSEHFCWLIPAKKHVTLGFNYGAELPDPAQLIEVTGKLFRHVKISTAKQLKDPALIALLRFATTYRVPAVH